MVGRLRSQCHRNKCSRPRTTVTLGGHRSGSVEPRSGLVECGLGGEWMVGSTDLACWLQLAHESRKSTFYEHMARKACFIEGMGVGGHGGTFFSPSRAGSVER